MVSLWDLGNHFTTSPLRVATTKTSHPFAEVYYMNIFYSRLAWIDEKANVGSGEAGFPSENGAIFLPRVNLSTQIPIDNVSSLDLF